MEIVILQALGHIFLHNTRRGLAKHTNMGKSSLCRRRERKRRKSLRVTLNLKFAKINYELVCNEAVFAGVEDRESVFEAGSHVIGIKDCGLANRSAVSDKDLSK